MAGQRLVLGSETRLSLGRYHQTMTNGGLAKSYMFKAEKRLKILSILLEEEDYSDVVREAQEIVERVSGIFQKPCYNVQ
jgi:hypothetical protein